MNGSMVRGLLLACLAAGAIDARQLYGQQFRGLTGIILDSVSHRPLQGAQVYFTTAPTDSRTGSDGRFRLAVTSAADTLLVARRIGFVPTTFTVHLDPNVRVSDVGYLQLRPAATKLDQIVVETEEVRRYPQLSGFYDRKHDLSGFGHFITRESIEHTAAIRTSDVLRRSHKLEIECGRMPGATCIATSRRARETRNLVRVRDSLNTETAEMFLDAARCRMEVWVDGVRSPFELDLIPVDWVVGIEVYSGPGTVPPVFGQGACGVVAIWTDASGR